MMRGAASTNGKNRARKARQRHHPYERKSIPVEANKSGNLEEDRISKLPEDILITILSLLTIKEAGRSSVLSSRWRYLWTFFTGKLDIGYKDNGTRKREDILLSEVFEKLENYQHSFGYNRDMFNIDELDKVLRNFQKCLDIPVSESGVLVKICIKCVSRFELDLERQPGNYAKIYKLRGAKRLLTSSNPAHNSFTSLTSLHLRYVNVSGEILEHFLANCHFLKQLRVIHSQTLVKLNVTGPSLELALLEISDCYPVRFLNISAENLVSLTYIGPSEPLVLSNVPLLSQMSIAGDILSSLENKSCKHYTAIQQLKSLRVTMEEMTTVEPKFRPNFPVLHCLGQLELNIEVTYGKDLMFYVSLVKACPLLYRLAMRYTYVDMDPSIEEGELYVIRYREKRLEKTDKTPIKVTAEFQHLSLKVVELIGFIGYETDLELVFSLVEIAVSLEKLVIEPSKHYPGESRRRVRKLEEDLPSSVNLLVL